MKRIVETAPNCPDCGAPVKCPACGAEATYQTPDGFFWDAKAHYWLCDCKKKKRV